MSQIAYFFAIFVPLAIIGGALVLMVTNSMQMVLAFALTVLLVLAGVVLSSGDMFHEVTEPAPVAAGRPHQAELPKVAAPVAGASQ